VYSETFSDSGLFQIHSDADGIISYAIQARIGSQAEKQAAASAMQPTLADVYRSLQGGSAEVPDLVKRASAQLAQQQAALPPLPALPAEELSPITAPLAKSATESDFKTNYCRDFREYSYLWHWETCDWAGYVHYIQTGWVDSRNGLTDRVYAYNNSPFMATLELYDTHLTSHPNTWKPTMQPYWWTWFTWGGTYTAGVVMMTLPVGGSGELGLSTHAPYSHVQ